MIYLHGAIEIESAINGTIFKVNGQRLKSYLTSPQEELVEKEVLSLHKPQNNRIGCNIGVVLVNLFFSLFFLLFCKSIFVC
jgi:hypothetical protein